MISLVAADRLLLCQSLSRGPASRPLVAALRHLRPFAPARPRLPRSAVLLMRYAARHGRSLRLLVALERRVNFTLADLEARAPSYDFWRTLFRATQRPGQCPAAAGAPLPAASIESQRGTPGGLGPADAQPPLPLVGWRLDVGSIPRAIQYQRSEYLELWELALSEGT